MTQMNDFKVLRFVAAGSFGQVYRVLKKCGSDHQKVYAMKIVPKMNTQIDKFTVTERRILEIARHPFIVDLVYAFQTNKRFHFVFEFCWGNLNTLVKHRNKLISEKFAAFYMREIVLAVQHLHDMEIIHRDLKPQNILIDLKGHVKLADFGTSIILVKENKTKKFCGTFGYIAPEMLSGTYYGKPVDWFALGAVFYEFLMGYPVFFECKKDKLLKSILEKEYLESMNSCLSAPAIDLITRFLCVNPSERLGVSGFTEIQEHVFFQNTNWNKVFKKAETPPFLPSCDKEDMWTFNVNLFQNEMPDEMPKPFYKDFDYHSPNLNVSKPSKKRLKQRFHLAEEGEVPFYERSDDGDGVGFKCCPIL